MWSHMPDRTQLTEAIGLVQDASLGRPLTVCFALAFTVAVQAGGKG